MPHDATLTICLAAGLGVALIVLAHWLRLPSIVLLLVGGVALGPELLGWIDPSSLGGGLELVIALSVAVILFEGGLTLDLTGYRQAPVVISRLLTIGSLVTWLGTAAAVYWLFPVGGGIALMAGSLVIVTGPTVVSPLLRRINIPQRLHHVLYWEAVVIDAVGVFVAVLCYEWLTPDPGHPLWTPLTRFGLRILLGVGLGALVGLVLAWLLEHDWVPEEQVNIAVLAAALLTFVVSHELLSESGILAVVVAGLVIGWRQPPQLGVLRRFKLQLTEVGIGLLFILLAAHLELRKFANPALLILLPIVLFGLRPLGILLSTWGKPFNWRERALLSWIAPRGIVAASMASLFSLRLADAYPGAEVLETVTYAVIATTVTLQGLSAGVVARLLGLRRSATGPWVLCGDPTIVDALGRGLRRAGVAVTQLTPGPEGTVDLDDPALASPQGFLAADTTMLQNVWAVQRWGQQIQPLALYRWATWEATEPVTEGAQTGKAPAGQVVWPETRSAVAVAEGLAAGSHTVDVIELGDNAEEGRFGPAQRPLFWVRDGQAEIVPRMDEVGHPAGDLAVVLRRRIGGLAQLIESVQMIGGKPDLEGVLRALGDSVARNLPELPVETLFEDLIARRASMAMVLGPRVAIAHTYADTLEHSRCFLGVAAGGISDMSAADGKPAELLFLLISPAGESELHLKSLAGIASLIQDSAFVELLVRQTVPQRIIDLIDERA